MTSFINWPEAEAIDWLRDIQFLRWTELQSSVAVTSAEAYPLKPHLLRGAEITAQFSCFFVIRQQSGSRVPTAESRPDLREDRIRTP